MLNPAAAEFVPFAQRGSPATASRVPLATHRVEQPEQLPSVTSLMRARLAEEPGHATHDDAVFMLDEIQQRGIADSEALFVAKNQSDRLAGVLKLGPAMPAMPGIELPTVSIQQMVAYPPRRGGGSALVQQAVNHSQGQHCDGNLRLMSMGEEDNKFYEALGFEQNGPWLVLQPEHHKASGLWTQAPSKEWSLNPAAIKRDTTQ